MTMMMLTRTYLPPLGGRQFVVRHLDAMALQGEVDNGDGQVLGRGVQAHAAVVAVAQHAPRRAGHRGRSPRAGVHPV